jgi:hypothetical protein
VSKVANFNPHAHRSKLYSSDIENHIVVSYAHYNRKFVVLKYYPDLRADTEIPPELNTSTDNEKKTTLDFYKGKRKSKFNPDQPVMQVRIVNRKCKLKQIS